MSEQSPIPVLKTLDSDEPAFFCEPDGDACALPGAATPEETSKPSEIAHASEDPASRSASHG